MDLSVRIGSLLLKNPLIAASGCFGYGVEYADVVDLSSLGAIAVKGLFLSEREGHAAPRIVETPAGMLNAIGLQGIGVRRFVSEKLPELRARNATVVVNVCGTTLDEYVEVSRILSDAEGVGAIELNISCPNIKEGGIQFGCSLNGTYDVVSAVRKVTRLPVIPKLTPNVTDVPSFARAAEEGGADAVSLVNTFLAMVIDIETRQPKISNVVGGLSGPAIRPIAVRMVYECRQTVRIPIIGMGGIADARDALEFMIAGATAVQVGTANFVDPFIWTKLLDGIREYMHRHRVACERIHGNRSQAQRTQALAGFKAGRFRVLVATDIAARGIDVEALSHVVNFDVPNVPDDYIHRVGRTARAEMTGDAFTFVAPEEEGELRAIERAIGKRLPRITLPGFDYTKRPAERFEVPIGERIAAIRARKAEERARARINAERRAQQTSAAPARTDGTPRPTHPGAPRRRRRRFGR